ncbi:hypothetical protein ACQ4PT_066215 [Festuca glaucescens]
MGGFGSKESSSGRQQQQHQDRGRSAAPAGHNRFAKFGDDYHTLEQVTDALSHAGLESSNLIVGIDFTKSNEWTATTHDQKVFSFYLDNQSCDGFEQALGRYREIVPQLRLAGPTSFAPMIETAIGIVDSSGGQYHVLLILADGQVTRSVDTGNGQLSPQERETIDAIVKASDYPLSLCLLESFVNFTEIMSRPIPTSKKEAEFALSALMEIPAQFKATMNLQLLGKRRGFPHRSVMPPPVRVYQQQSGCSAVKHTQSTSTTSYGSPQKKASAPPQDSDTGDQQTCPICWTEAKNLAFGCGHQTCADCGKDLKVCPLCQRQISTRIKLY